MAVFIGQPLLISGIIVMSQLLDKIKNPNLESNDMLLKTHLIIKQSSNFKRNDQQ